MRVHFVRIIALCFLGFLLLVLGACNIDPTTKANNSPSNTTGIPSSISDNLGVASVPTPIRVQPNVNDTITTPTIPSVKTVNNSKAEQELIHNVEASGNQFSAAPTPDQLPPIFFQFQSSAASPDFHFYEKVKSTNKRMCVKVGNGLEKTAQSGEFLAGFFIPKIWWSPLHTDLEDTLSVKALSLNNSATTINFGPFEYSKSEDGRFFSPVKFSFLIMVTS